MVLVETCFREATIATRDPNSTSTRITPLTRTGTSIVLTLRSTKGVEEAASFWLTRTTAAVTAGIIELLVLVGWYIARLMWQDRRIAHIASTGKSWIRRVMYRPMRWQGTVFNWDSTRLLRLIERVCRQLLLQLLLFTFSQLVLLVVEPLKNYRTSVSLQLLVLLFVVQVDHLPVKEKR